MKKFIRIAILMNFGFPLLLSCGGSQLKKSVEEFSGTEIEFRKLQQIFKGNDSSEVRLDSIPVLLVVYKDKNECVPCQIGHLGKYRKMVDFKRDVGGGYEAVFIFSPERKDMETAYITLYNANVKFPLFLDKEGVFAVDNNSIPDEPELHVFLLDKNRKVVLAGDPSHNSSLWDLYKRIIVKMLENGGTMP